MKFKIITTLAIFWTTFVGVSAAPLPSGPTTGQHGSMYLDHMASTDFEGVKNNRKREWWSNPYAARLYIPEPTPFLPSLNEEE